MQVQRLMTLVMKFRIPLVADHSVRKVSVHTKAMTRGELPRYIQVCAVHIVAELGKAAKKGITFGGAHRQNRFAGMERNRQDYGANGNYS